VLPVIDSATGDNLFTDIDDDDDDDDEKEVSNSWSLITAIVSSQRIWSVSTAAFIVLMVSILRELLL